MNTFQPNPSVAAFITSCIERTVKSQAQISEECGFERPNIITMIKQGKTNLPFNKILKMARSLEVDPKYLLALAFEEYRPEEWAMIREILQQPVLNENEIEFIDVLRSAGVRNPKLSTINRQQLREFCKTLREDI